MSVTLSITVSDANAQRVANALGSYKDTGTVPGPSQTVWTPASVAQVQAQIKQWIQQRVLDYEANNAASVVKTNVSQETW